MGQAIGQILPLGVVVALSPIPIVGVVLMLTTPRGRVNGLAFVAGWIVGLSLLGTAVLLVAAGLGAGSGVHPADWASWLKVLLAVLLLRLALKQWRKRPGPGEDATLPGWLRAVDHFDARRAAGLGVALSAANPKNLVLVLSAAVAIAQAGISSGEQAVVLAVFVLIGTLGPGAPVAIYFALGERSKRPLEELRDWMGRNSAVIMAVVCLIIAAKLIGDAISGLSA